MKKALRKISYELKINKMLSESDSSFDSYSSVDSKNI
jgi:hypothetical protein